MVSDVMEDHLKAIYVLQYEDDSPVRTSAIANYLDVTAPTVSSMLSSLEDRGLVSREKYAGTVLTADGERIALETIRHHRLLECFLEEYLDYDWSEVHDEADVLEHYISESFERRIAAALDDPEVDPHGDPIPPDELTKPTQEDTEPLSTYSAGESVVVARVSDRDTEELEYLARAGILPGTTVYVREVAPIGMYVLEHDDATVHLPESIADATEVYEPSSTDESPVAEVSDS